MKMSSQAESLHDGLLSELERVLLHGERAAPNAKQLEDDLRSLHSDHRLQKSQGFEETLSTAVELLRRVQPKKALQFDLLTPAVCSRSFLQRSSTLEAPSASNAGWVSEEGVSQFSRTVLAPKVSGFDAGEHASGRAIPLCLPNDCEWKPETNACEKIEGATRSRLDINPAALEILKRVSGPVCVVGIVGPCRTGKSYILGELFRPSGGEQLCFRLGHNMDPETIGIWMWDTPFKHRLRDGKEVTMILLDTEGSDAYSASGRGDNQIFTLSVILSSLLIYNSSNVPKREDLKSMNFVANLAKSISGRGGRALKRGEAKQITPAFLWLLRDVILEPTDQQGKPCHIRDYLVQNILSQYDSDDFEESVPTKTSRFLLEYFHSFDAEMLPPPSANKDFMQNIEDPQCKEEISPHFSQQVEFVRQKILEKCVPKRGYIQGSCITGTQLAEMLVQYVAALNMPGGIPEVDSTWELVLKSTYDRAIANALAVYEEQMQVMISQLPLEVDDLMVAHSKAKSSALELFESEVDCEHSLHDKYLTKLQEDLATFSSTPGECDGGILHSYMLRNEAASKKECRELLQSLKQSLLTPLLNSPSSQNDFSTIDEVQKEIHGKFHESAKGPAKHHVYQEFMKEFERDKQTYLSTLKTLKNYEELSREQMQRIQTQQLLYEEQMAAKEYLTRQLEQSKLESEKQLRAMEERMAAKEEDFKKEHIKHQKELEALQDANRAYKRELDQRNYYYQQSRAEISGLRSRISQTESDYMKLKNTVLQDDGNILIMRYR